MSHCLCRWLLSMHQGHPWCCRQRHRSGRYGPHRCICRLGVRCIGSALSAFSLLPTPNPQALLTCKVVSTLEAIRGAETGGKTGALRTHEHPLADACFSPPLPFPNTLGPLSPALAVLCCRDLCANIMVVSIIIIASTLGHTLHLVLIEEGLTGWALWVAA